ncbi:PTS galactitol transporter subunit IIC [Thermoflavimicrobium daqui]|uniref:PTS galactitol transporter subunit IIC n=1 Tax=Thermoflavimicrobium daqui TaxID=2137476 RepID=A0A364K120_9BACL|nr:PTS transporter subunit IIC [Thermoflavimicrobium daqui]RAL21381.1 PTS galactitol transporter subunit IIC [Thermoflavimicrobium daqui]
MLEKLKMVFDTFGASIFVPLVILIVALSLKVPLKKAIYSSLYAGIGLQGFTLLLNAFIPIISPVVQDMVKSTGIQLPVFDIGWQATSIVAYSTKVGMIFLVLGTVLQIFLFVIKWTNVFQPGDLWNNYSYMVWGSMMYLITENMLLAIGCMIVLNLFSLLFSEMIAKRWSTYFNYPNCTIVQLHHVGTAPFGIGMNWILNKLGADQINLSPTELQRRLGFLGEPIVLGLLLGIFLGILGNFDQLGKLSSWGEITIIGISTSAVMAIFPKVAGIFSQAFLPLTEAAKKKAKKPGSKSREWYLGVNDAMGYGETATLISGIILIPIMVLLALVLPGNKVLPLVDLIALPYMVQGIVAIMNGNIFKVLISGVIWFSMGLYVATYTAPMFTEVATSVGVKIPSAALLVTSFGILTKPIASLIFLAFLSKSWLLIGLVIVIYLISFYLFRKNKDAFYQYLENSAKGKIEEKVGEVK